MRYHTAEMVRLMEVFKPLSLEDRIRKISHLISKEGRMEGKDKDFCCLSCKAVQELVAIEFGWRNGWKLARTPFSVIRLVPFALSADDLFLSDSQLLDNSQFGIDHQYCYRKKNGAPVAIASHNYGLKKEEFRYSEIVESHGLRVQFPELYPSWYYPGQTTLVVYTRA
jgi:hypothetical protein